MCGIAGFHVKPGCRLDLDTLERFADALLIGIDERGGDATGFVARGEGGSLVRHRASCDVPGFLAERRSFPRDVRTVLLHTRFATQGDAAFPENNHPVDAGDVYCIHNGHVSNDGELFRETGAERRGRVDSEAIPMLVNHFGWDNAATALTRLEGQVAVALLNQVSGDLILARGYASPLVIVDSPNLVVWASTEYAIRGAWSRVLGTAPAKARFVHAREGELIRFGLDGSRSSETFASYAPTYSGTIYSYDAQAWGTSSLRSIVESVRKPSERTGGRWFGGTFYPDAEDGEWTDAPVDAPESVKRCDSCSDWYPERELYEIYSGCRVCPACEEWVNDADSTAGTFAEYEKGA